MCKKRAIEEQKKRRCVKEERKNKLKKLNEGEKDREERGVGIRTKIKGEDIKDDENGKQYEEERNNDDDDENTKTTHKIYSGINNRRKVKNGSNKGKIKYAKGKEEGISIREKKERTKGNERKKEKKKKKDEIVLIQD